MLSQSNIDKLRLDGIYRCDPVLEWLPSYKRDMPYWCRNWAFKVRHLVSRDQDKYYMADTYWDSLDGAIELTDENFDKFEYMFDLGEVKFVHDYTRWLEYPEEDRWHIGLDSGGAKYVVRQGADKIKERVVERLQNEINSLKTELSHKERILERVLSGELDVKWV